MFRVVSDFKQENSILASLFSKLSCLHDAFISSETNAIFNYFSRTYRPYIFKKNIFILPTDRPYMFITKVRRTTNQVAFALDEHSNSMVVNFHSHLFTSATCVTSAAVNPAYSNISTR